MKNIVNSIIKIMTEATRQEDIDLSELTMVIGGFMLYMVIFIAYVSGVTLIQDYIMGAIAGLAIIVGFIGRCIAVCD